MPVPSTALRVPDPCRCPGMTRPPSGVLRKHLPCLSTVDLRLASSNGGSHPDPAGATRSPVRKSTRSSLPAPLSAPTTLAVPASPPTGAAIISPPAASRACAAQYFVRPWRWPQRSGKSTQACRQTERCLPDPVKTDRAVPWHEEPGNREEHWSPRRRRRNSGASPELHRRQSCRRARAVPFRAAKALREIAVS